MRNLVISRIISTLLICLIILLSTTACVVTPTITNLNELAENEILLVGRFEIEPPLEKNDQILKGIGSEHYRNKLVCGLGAIVLNKLKLKNMKYMVAIPIGEDFYIKRPYSNPLYFSLPSIIINTVPQEDHLYLPGCLQYKVLPDDKAIYIGTIRYHRNIYLEITNVEFLDEYDRARKAFEEKFGTDIPLKKVKITVVEK